MSTADVLRLARSLPAISDPETFMRMFHIYEASELARICEVAVILNTLRKEGIDIPSQPYA